MLEPLEAVAVAGLGGVQGDYSTVNVSCRAKAGAGRSSVTPLRLEEANRLSQFCSPEPLATMANRRVATPVALSLIALEAARPRPRLRAVALGGHQVLQRQHHQEAHYPQQRQKGNSGESPGGVQPRVGLEQIGSQSAAGRGCPLTDNRTCKTLKVADSFRPRTAAYKWPAV
ncbi:hypothetical protein SG1530 [Sodalis glossinidius str. 'morsitans']|uniref:Uncharacterized protein n=1 Tax=Sodalis glossinidius (strain morsitans) TaxID=343509 RepID=Q2NSS0_SODGM|nr:hypothetical protein SG1530 [Sodalis glossinidius str. 'morsitans']